MERDFLKGGSLGWEEFAEKEKVCYMDVEMLLGCETAVVSFGACQNCFLTVVGQQFC